MLLLVYWKMSSLEIYSYWHVRCWHAVTVSFHSVSIDGATSPLLVLGQFHSLCISSFHSLASNSRGLFASLLDSSFVCTRIKYCLRLLTPSIISYFRYFRRFPLLSVILTWILKAHSTRSSVSSAILAYSPSWRRIQAHKRTLTRSRARSHMIQKYEWCWNIYDYKKIYKIWIMCQFIFNI